MKRSVLLLSMTLLACSGIAQADGIGMSYVGMSMSALQFSSSGPCMLAAPCLSPCLISPTIGHLSPVIVLCPTLHPCMMLSSAGILVGGVSVQPSPSLMVLGTQMSMAAAGHNMAMAIITNMR